MGCPASVTQASSSREREGESLTVNEVAKRNVSHLLMKGRKETSRTYL